MIDNEQTPDEEVVVSGSADTDPDHVPERLASPNHPGEGYAMPCQEGCGKTLYGSTARGAVMATVRHRAAIHPKAQQWTAEQINHTVNTMEGNYDDEND